MFGNDIDQSSFKNCKESKSARGLTPLFSCATLRARSFKFMPRWSRQEQHGVRKDSLNLPRFYSRIQVQFSFFHDLLFALSRFGFHRTFMFYRDALGF